MISKKDRGPGVKFPPPLIFVCCVLPAYFLNSYWSLSINWPRYSGAFGLCLITAGIVIAGLSALHFWQAKTHIEPWQPATALLSKGVFSISRNPIYLSFILVTLGLGFLLENIWIILSNVPATFFVYKWVILKEEAYLETKFGDSYREYKKTVRRWL